MMDTSEHSFRVAVTLLLLLLPILSALHNLKAARDRRAFVYLRCLLAYAASLILIASGYLFQCTIDVLPQIGRFTGGWDQLWLLLQFWPKGVLWSVVVVEAFIIQFVVLLSKKRTNFAVVGFRSAFLTLAFGDVLMGIVRSHTPGDYVLNVGFDLIGAIAFGAVNAAILGRVLPWARPNNVLSATGNEGLAS